MSIASDILRIQSAKSALKTAINAKNKAPNLITDELIDGYAAFVNSITTNAFQVQSVEEMNAITDMVEGDYCVVAPPAATTATFTRFTGTPADLLSGVYSDYTFLIVMDAYGWKVLTDVVVKYNTQYSYYGCELVSQTFTNDQITYELNDDNKKYMFK